MTSHNSKENNHKETRHCERENPRHPVLSQTFLPAGFSFIFGFATMLSTSPTASYTGATVAETYTYHVNPVNLKKFLQHIQTAGVPSSKVTFQYISSVGFRGSNDRAIITVLKAIGFLDDSGHPTDTWRAYRNKSQSKKVLAAALRKAYATLFTTYPDANRKDTEALRNFFSSHTSVGEGALGYMVRTFKTLADMADFESPAESLPEVEVEVEEQEEKGGAVVKRKVVTTTPNGMTVNINIQLQIPATDKAEVYDSFFAAMKKHLLS
jgi:hypothetical protein